MRRLAVLAWALLAVDARAATAYVSDELVVGVYSEQNQQGQRLTTLHSGASVETLTTSGEFTQVRLSDGTTGWVKTTYLTTREPATVRVKRLEEELDRSRATTPALAEAAARSEVEHLQRELAAKQSELDAARVTHSAAAAGISPAGAAKTVSGLGAVCAVLIAAAGGFWLGYATLARRVKRKFGGLRVY
ncbi:MAG: TIGR04211 family SH3 domain-containing protein [Steroidobacteraceae bacterium]